MLYLGSTELELLRELEAKLGMTHITPDGDRHWLLRLDVCSYMGIGRFVLGLFENVEVLGGEGFCSYIEGKRRRMAAGDG